MIYKSFLEQITDLSVRRVTKSKIEKMYSLCRSIRCRRKELLSYFGEIYPAASCNGCDRCLDRTELVDETVIAQKILSCVYRLDQKFGIQYVIDVLRGSKKDAILKNGHDQLSTYRLMPEFSEEDLRSFIDALIEKDFLQRSAGQYPILQWTESSALIVRGQCPVMIPEKSRKVVERKKEKDLICDQDLFRKLSQLRSSLAKQSHVPTFVIFGDKTLIEMAKIFPLTQDALLQINGVGPIKWQKYGTVFLDAIVKHCTKEPVS